MKTGEKDKARTRRAHRIFCSVSESCFHAAELFFCSFSAFFRSALALGHNSVTTCWENPFLCCFSARWVMWSRFQFTLQSSSGTKMRRQHRQQHFLLLSPAICSHFNHVMLAPRLASDLDWRRKNVLSHQNNFFLTDSLHSFSLIHSGHRSASTKV